MHLGVCQESEVWHSSAIKQRTGGRREIGETPIGEMQQDDLRNIENALQTFDTCMCSSRKNSKSYVQKLVNVRYYRLLSKLALVFHKGAADAGVGIGILGLYVILT